VLAVDVDTGVDTDVEVGVDIPCAGSDIPCADVGALGVGVLGGVSGVVG